MKRALSFLLACSFLAGCKSSDQPSPKPVAAVSVQQVRTRDAQLLVTAPAEIHGKSEAHLSSRITATVQRLLVHEGDRVTRGQLLLVLEQADLAAQSRAAAAQAAGAEAALHRTENATLPIQLTQARGDLAAKKAALELADRTLARRRDLLTHGAISERELEATRAQQAQAKADFDAASISLATLERHANADDLRIAQSNAEQSRAGAQLAKANLGFSELRSPSSGTITEQHVFRGDLASPGTPLLTVTDLSSAVARAQVSESDAPLVRLGQPCAFLRKGDDSPAATGRITVVNQAIDTARRTVEVWCEIPNAGAGLKAGEFGSVQIDVGIAHDAVVLPASAVEFNEGTQDAKVYVVDPQRIAHVRQVKAVLLNETSVRILSGLSPGETVIARGEYGLPDGTQVTTDGGRQ